MPDPFQNPEIVLNKKAAQSRRKLPASVLDAAKHANTHLSVLLSHIIHLSTTELPATKHGVSD